MPKSVGDMAREEIKRLRDSGMTLDQIAALCACNASTLASVANGEIGNPSAELLDSLKLITPPVVEKRSFTGEGSIAWTPESKKIQGLAAVYYDGTPATEFQLTPKIIERVHPGAFNSILESRSDVLALYNHDQNQFLGRRSSGTLSLADSAKGLQYSVPYDSTDPIHQTVAARIARRDVVGSSFTFDVGQQTFERRSDGMIIRNIHSYKRVADVGPTHLPAYSGTSAELRSMQLEQLAATELGLEPPTPIEIARYLIG